MRNHSADKSAIEEILLNARLSQNPFEDNAVLAQVEMHLKKNKQDSNPFDVKRWLSSMLMNTNLFGNSSNSKDVAIYKLKRKGSIKHPSLQRFIRNKNIPLHIAQCNLKELLIYSPENHKHHYALGFRNDDTGFLVTNPVLSGWVGNPAISFIRGTNKLNDTINIFNDVWDYLSLLSHLKIKSPQTDTIILNAAYCVSQVNPYLIQSSYKKAYTWLPSSLQGKQLARYISGLIRQEKNLTHITMNGFYQPFISLNDWYLAQANH